MAHPLALRRRQPADAERTGGRGLVFPAPEMSENRAISAFRRGRASRGRLCPRWPSPSVVRRRYRAARMHAEQAIWQSRRHSRNLLEVSERRPATRPGTRPLANPLKNLSIPRFCAEDTTVIQWKSCSGQG